MVEKSLINILSSLSYCHSALIWDSLLLRSFNSFPTNLSPRAFYDKRSCEQCFGYYSPFILIYCSRFGLFISSIKFHVSPQESSWMIVNNKISDVFKNELANMSFTSMSSMPSFFQFAANQSMKCETHADYVLALFHAFWHHSSNGQFILLPT